MAKQRSKDRPISTTEWDTPAKRVKWLVDTKANGNRTAFAGAVGVSHTAINKITSGKPPGRKLLEAISRNFRDVNPTWLLTGEGQPLLDQTAAPDFSWLPVSSSLLPGNPQDYQGVVSKGRVVQCGNLFLPGQYWYRIGPQEPILHNSTRGFLEGDLLLLEGDRTRFPRESQLTGDLCAIRCRQGDLPVKLAGVAFREGSEGDPEGLRADTFDLDIEEQEMVKVQMYYHHPGGVVRHKEVPHRRICFRGGEHLVPVEDTDIEPAAFSISYTDIVAVWTRILHRTNTDYVE